MAWLGECVYRLCCAFDRKKKIEKQTFYCGCCKFIFLENKKLADPSIYTIESKKPCSSTFYIFKVADTFLKLYKPECFNKPSTDDTANNNVRDFRVLFYMILRKSI